MPEPIVNRLWFIMYISSERNAYYVTFITDFAFNYEMLGHPARLFVGTQ